MKPLVIVSILLFLGACTKKQAQAPVPPPPSALAAILSCPMSETDVCEDSLTTFILVDITGLKNYYADGEKFSTAVKTWIAKQGFDTTSLFATQELDEKLEEVYKLTPRDKPWQYKARVRTAEQIRTVFLGLSNSAR